MHIHQRGYVISLAIAAGLILVLGVLLRPAQVPTPPVKAGEAGQLQLLALRQTIEKRTDLLTSYVADLRPRIQRMRENPSPLSAHQPRTGEVLVIAALDRTGSVHWMTAEFSGRTAERVCGVHELAIAAVIPPPLEDAVAFTMSEQVAGVVARCGERRLLVAPKDLTTVNINSAINELWECCGIRIGDEGRIVELRVGSTLERRGVQVGDQLLGIDGADVNGPVALRERLQKEPIRITVRRSDQILDVVPGTTRSPYSVVSNGILVGNLPPDSRGAQVGLRSGDVVICLDSRPRPSLRQFTKALTSDTLPELAIVREDRQILLGGTR